MTVGTVAYAAPEQLMGVDMDGRADQYALAATAFHLLTGAPPYQHSNPVAVISKHLNAPPPRLAEHRENLAPLDSVLSVALAKEPTARYPRCRDFAQALAQPRVATARTVESATPADLTMPAAAVPLNDLETEAVSTKPALSPSTTGEPLQPRRRRWRWATTVVPVVLAVLLLGAVAFAITQVMRPDPQPSTAAPQWGPYVDYAKQFAVSLTSLAPSPPIATCSASSTGRRGFPRRLVSKRSEFQQQVVNSNASTHGSVNDAGLDSISGTTAHVLVVATEKTTDNAGASQEPRNFRFLMQVEKIGDTYKVSKVEFVQ